MSATRSKSLRINHALADAFEMRAKNLGYPSWTAYLVGLGEYDCLTQSAHGVTIEWSKLTPEEKDLLGAKLLRRVLEGQGMRGADAKNVDWRKL
jgi:hypothetical protein